MKKKHSRKSRKNRNLMSSLLYILALLLIVCCLGFLYRVNRQKQAEHKVQKQQLMEDERYSDTSERKEQQNGSD